MAKDPDANPLYSKEPDAFTEELLKHFEQKENAAHKDKTISDVLEGTVRKGDALEIKNMLEAEKENGNRFVSFPSESPGLKRDDFVPFKTAFDALEHAHENSTDLDKYAARSIQVVENEMDKILGIKKEQSQEHQQDKSPDRSKDEGLNFVM